MIILLRHFSRCTHTYTHIYSIYLHMAIKEVNGKESSFVFCWCGIFSDQFEECLWFASSRFYCKGFTGPVFDMTLFPFFLVLTWPQALKVFLIHLVSVITWFWFMWSRLQHCRPVLNMPNDIGQSKRKQHRVATAPKLLLTWWCVHVYEHVIDYNIHSVYGLLIDKQEKKNGQHKKNLYMY